MKYLCTIKNSDRFEKNQWIAWLDRLAKIVLRCLLNPEGMACEFSTANDKQRDVQKIKKIQSSTRKYIRQIDRQPDSQFGRELDNAPPSLLAKEITVATRIRQGSSNELSSR